MESGKIILTDHKKEEVVWLLFLFRVVGKTRSRWSLAGTTKLQNWDKF